MNKALTDEIRTFLRRTRDEANRLADAMDPARRRRDKTGVLACLDAIHSRAAHALHLPMMNDGSWDVGGGERRGG